MPEPQWDDKLLEYVRRTGEDLKRTGEEFLDQAQRTFDDLRDPAQQERLKADARPCGHDATGWQRVFLRPFAGGAPSPTPSPPPPSPELAPAMQPSYKKTLSAQYRSSSTAST